MAKVIIKVTKTNGEENYEIYDSFNNEETIYDEVINLNCQAPENVYYKVKDI